jgi:hypothetical protein
MELSAIDTGSLFDTAFATESNDVFFFNQLPANQISLLSNSPGKDIIMLLGGDDSVTNNEESRTYYGMAGNDTIVGLGGNDTLLGNVGNDVLSGNEGSDILSGGQNDDLLFGGKDDDILNGDLGNDVLLGESGDDVLTGGGGNDTLTGGDGGDIFVLSDTGGTDFITDFENGIDFIQLSPSLTFKNLAITTTNSGQVLVSDKNTNQSLLVINGIAATDLTSADFITGNSEGIVDLFGERTSTKYEAFLSPQQEPGEAIVSEAKGYGKLSFPKNLSSLNVDVQMSGVDVSQVTAFHIHCGPPGVLGPIVVNFGQFGDFNQTIVDGKFSASISNENITFVDSPPDLTSSHLQTPDQSLTQSVKTIQQLPGNTPSLPANLPETVPHTHNEGSPPSVPTTAQVPGNTPSIPTQTTAQVPGNTPSIPTQTTAQVPGNTPTIPTNLPTSSPQIPQGLPQSVPTIPGVPVNTPTVPTNLPTGTPPVIDEGKPPSIPDNVPRLPEGCPVEVGLAGQVNTVAGIESLARRGELYFNLHTEQNSFYGEMRGQIYPAET